METRFDSIAHAKFHIRYHLIFSTKYRKSCFVGIEEQVEEAFQEAEAKSEFKIIAIGVERDHVHLVVKAKPSLSPLMIVRRLKQMTTKELWKVEERHLKQYYWGKRKLWSGGYFCSTVGQVSEDKVLEYVKNQ